MFKIKATAVAVAFAIAGGAQAATIDTTQSGVNGGAGVLVNIMRVNSDGTDGNSMLINTGLNSRDVADGVTTSYVSDVSLTSSIASFISGASSIKFWAIGVASDAFAFDTAAMGTSNSFLGDASAVEGYVTNINAYIDTANTGDYGNDVAGDGPDIETNLAPGSDLHYTNALTSGLFSPAGLNSSVVFKASMNDTFGAGFSTADLGSWMLSSNGELTYGQPVSAVPVPAAVWLFGSGLVGLVGIGRRRKSA